MNPEVEEIEGSTATATETTMEAAVIQGYRLSPQQRRLWQVQQAGGGALFCQLALRLTGPLDRHRLVAALEELIARHEILRTVYRRSPGMAFPVQVILEQAPPRLEEVDLRGFDPDRRRSRLAELLAGQLRREIDLGAAPGLVLALARLDEESHVLLMSLPSLSADAWTLDNLQRQLAAIYGWRPETGGGAEEPELTQYLQFSEWQLQLLEEDEAAGGLSVWRQDEPRAAGTVPLPFTAETAQPGSPAMSAACPVDAAGALAAAERLAATRGVTLSAVLLAAWQTLLARLAQRREATVAMPFTGRKYAELHDSFGRFSKWLPVRLEIEPHMPFGEALMRLQGSLQEAESWQEYFVAPDSEVAPAEFQFRERPQAHEAGGLTFAEAELRVEDEPVRLRLSCRVGEEGTELSLLHDPVRFSPPAAAYLAARYAALLADAVAHPDKPVSVIDLLGEAERRHLLADWSRGGAPDGGQEPVHRVFARRAAQAPGAVAVVCSGRTLTYGELATRVSSLAQRLRRRGVVPGSLVPVRLPRSPELVVALLGVLEAGAAYVPLDPDQPPQRLDRMLAGLDPPVVVTGASPAAEGMEEGRLLRLEAESPPAGETPSEPPPVPLDSLAYVLYTSGSTGAPKGVMVTHRGLANYLGWCVEAYDVAAGGGAVVHSPVGFDLTVTSLLAPLTCGARVVLLPEEAGLEALASALAEAEVALFKLTPSHLDAVAELLRTELPPRRRRLVIGGEPLSRRSLAAWWRLDPQARAVNEYGPTETVVGCCAAFLEPGGGAEGPVPIGGPIACTSTYVLDRRLRPVAAGVRGELHVAGAGVARGYLGLPALTAARFIPDPFAEASGGRLYRTGDLVRWRLDGELEFLGRMDAQVKMRGHRVEPAEIEAALERHPEVAEAVVLARSDNGRGPQLAAYFTAAGASPAAGELRSFLQRELPEYMIPAAFAQLPAFPLTANGKVDLEALRAQAARRSAPETPYVAPESELERALAEIWKEVLRVERVGLYDNFFELGGHSILMVQVFSRIKAQHETALQMVELFEFPTVSSMAKRLLQEREQTAPPDLTSGRADARLETLQEQEEDAAAVRIGLRRDIGDV